LSIEQKIKKEMYEYVSKFELDSEEMKIIDTYVLEMLNNLKPIFESHSEIISNDEKINKIKELILNKIGED